MLTELCAEVKNYFNYGIVFAGTYTIKNGTLNISKFQPGQYFRIVGSHFNDGVYRYPAADLTDETFRGAIWPMDIPPDFFKLMDDIQDWKAKYGDIELSPYQSESFDGYSYNRGTSAAGGTGGSWQDVFASRLNRYRKLRP